MRNASGAVLVPADEATEQALRGMTEVAQALETNHAVGIVREGLMRELARHINIVRRESKTVGNTVAVELCDFILRGGKRD